MWRAALSRMDIYTMLQAFLFLIINILGKQVKKAYSKQMLTEFDHSVLSSVLIMKVLDTDFGYGDPFMVIAAKFIGEPFMETYPAFKRYVRSLEKKLKEGYTHFEYKKQIYSLNKEGVQTALESVVGRGFQLNGELYAIKDYKEEGKYVGDYVGLTGGSKPYGKKEKGIEVPFYHETFNAGSGRVTAGIEGSYYIGEKVVAYKATTSHLL